MEEQTEIRIPESGWHWLRVDSQTHYERQYYRDGRLFAHLAAKCENESHWTVFVAWAGGESVHKHSVSIRELACQMVDLVAIGILATCGAMGIELQTLNPVSDV